MSTVRIPRVGWDPCAGLRGGCPISVDPVESGMPAPSWMGSGGEWTPWRQFGARTELARLRVVSPPEQKLFIFRLTVDVIALFSRRLCAPTVDATALGVAKVSLRSFYAPIAGETHVVRRCQIWPSL